MSEPENLDEGQIAPDVEPGGADSQIDDADETHVASATGRSPDQDLSDKEGELTAKYPAFMGVPIEVVISVGKARPLVSELVKFKRDSVIALDSKIDDPVEVYVGDRLIARGELQEMENQEGCLGVRLTEVADLSNGV